MAIQPLLQSYLGPGYVPGRVTPGTNFYEQMLRRSQLADQQAVGRFGAQVDRQTYFDYAQSFALMSGQPFGPDQQAQARKIADDVGRVAPFIAGVAPDLFDQLHGARGSALLLGQQVYAGGRYATDPVTGARGFTRQTAEQYTQEIYDQLYGPNADVRRMRGTGAGQAGILFDEMQRRGLSAAPLDREESLARVARESNMTVEEAIKLPDFGDKVRKLEAGRAAQQIKEMSAAVGAMRELFGDAGRPDAPMAELINAVQGLTQNGLGNMAPREVERLVRQAGNVARGAGTDIRGVMQLTSTVSPLTDRLGLGRDTAVQNAIGGLAFADAFGRTAGNLGLRGGLDKEQAAVLGATLEATAAASPQFQRLAAVQRLVEEYGVDDKGRGDSDLSRLYRASKAGKDTYTAKDGKEKSIFVDAGQGEDSFIDLARRLGGEKMVRLAGNVSANSFANDPYAARLAQTFRGAAQQQDVGDLYENAFRSVTAVDTDEGLIGGGDATRRSAVVDAVGTTARTLFTTRTAEQKAGMYEPATERGKKAYDEAQAAVEAELAKKNIRLTEQERQELRQSLIQGTETFRQEGGRRLGAVYGPEFARAQNADIISSRDVIAAQRDSLEDARVKESIQSRVAELGQLGPVRQAIETFRRAGPGTTLQDFLAAPFGFVKAEERDKLLGPALREFSERTETLKTDNPFQLKKQLEILQKKDTPEAKAEIKKIEDRYGKPANELIKMSDQQMRSAGQAQYGRWLDQNIGPLQDETTRIEERLSTDQLNQTWRQLQANDPAAARKARETSETLLNDPRAIAALGDGGVDAVGRMRAFATALDRSQGMTGEVKVADKDKAEVQRLRDEYANRMTGLSTAASTIEELSKKAGGRDKLTADVQATPAERAEYKTRSDAATEARKKLDTASTANTSARQKGVTGDPLKKLEDNEKEMRKDFMAADVRVQDYLTQTGLSSDRLSGPEKPSAMSAEDQKKYRDSYQALRANPKAIKETVQRATVLSNDYNGDAVGLLAKRPEDRAAISEVLRATLQEDAYDFSSAVGRGGYRAPQLSKERMSALEAERKFDYGTPRSGDTLSPFGAAVKEITAVIKDGTKFVGTLNLVTGQAELKSTGGVGKK